MSLKQCLAQKSAGDKLVNDFWLAFDWWRRWRDDVMTWWHDDMMMQWSNDFPQHFLPPQRSLCFSQSNVLLSISTLMLDMLYPVVLKITSKWTPLFSDRFKDLVGFVNSRFSTSDRRKNKRQRKNCKKKKHTHTHTRTKGVSGDFLSNRRFTGTTTCLNTFVDVVYFCGCCCFAVSIDASKNLALKVN